MPAQVPRQEHETDDSEFEAIKKRYSATRSLNFTREQASRVYEFEQLRDMPSDKHHFSIWEEFDFELTTFQDILTPAQFHAYKIKHQELVSVTGKQVALKDREYGKHIEAATDLLHYYLRRLLPDLERQRLIVWQAFITDITKIEYLKAEYKKYLDNRKKVILIEHFRHSKALQPQLLQLSLLNHKLSCLLPDYFSFRAGMDVPTRVIADYLDTKLKRGAEMILQGLKETMQAFEDFKKDNKKKHLGETGGWHTTIASREDTLMFMLLLDQEKYSC